MKIQTVVELEVVAKVIEEYDLPVKDESGKEIGRNKGNSFKISARVGKDKLPETISLGKAWADKFAHIEEGQVNKFIVEFETSPKAYIKDGKAAVNFQHVPTFIDLVPFKK